MLVSALARHDVDARWAAWSDPAVVWADALVVLRSTWDYTEHRGDFLRWAEQLPLVANGADVVAWNANKTYLRDLDAAGLPIVPTVFVEPGEDADRSGAFDSLAGDPEVSEVVVKPSVGAGSRGVGRFAADRVAAARAHVAALHADGRTVLVQPYLSDVDTAGETALVYVDGVFSHSIRKAPLLVAGGGAHGDYVGERVEPRTPTADEQAVGQDVLAAVRDRFGADQLYTRVDLLPSPAGPRIVELELIEPSLFLRYGTGAADRLARAIAART